MGEQAAERGIGERFASAIDGDHEAWNELVDRLSPAIWAVARSHRLGRAQAEDLAQTVWLRLVDNVANIRDPDRLPGWIQTTARNEALSILRRQSRSPDSIDAAPLEMATAEPGPAELVSQNAEQQALLDGLDELPDDRCRALLRLLAYGVAYRDVAEMLDLAIGSIGETRRRCLHKLRETPSVRALINP